MLNLVAGLATGLARIGWKLDIQGLAPAHGAIMVGGFLGTLIAIEKLIPLRNYPLFIVPTLSGCSLITFYLDLPEQSILMLTVASFCLTGIFAFYYFKHREPSYLIMLTGAVCWFIGNILLYTKNFYPLAFPMWLGFVLLIIVGERMEIMKFLPVSRKQKRVMFILLGLYLTSTVFAFHGIGNIVAGVSLIGIALWLLRFDVIGINILKTGLTRYIAVALLCGYVSLMICGIFFIALKGSPMSYDAVVHSFFLGFVFSMIFAHGPIILPGVLGMNVKPFSKIFYVWLVTLQISWLTRVFADTMLDFQVRKISGVLSAIAIPGFLISLVILTLRDSSGKTL